MKVHCEKCKNEYNIDEGRVPPEGLKIKCPRCSATFIVAQGGGVPNTAGDLFDVGNVDLPRGKSHEDSLELDLSKGSKPSTKPPWYPATKGKPGAAGIGSSTLPPLDKPNVRSPAKAPISAFAAAPPDVPPSAKSKKPKPGSEGQIFDFQNRDLAAEPEAERPQPVRYRIRRKSGKVFGPFDAETIQKMLTERQLTGDEEVSEDGHNFKPFGAFEEFVEIITQLIEEPITGETAPPDPQPPVAGAELESVGEARAYQRVRPAKPPFIKKMPLRLGPVMLVGGLFLLLLSGVGLGFTKFGFFGYHLIMQAIGSGKTDEKPAAEPRAFQNAAGGGLQELFSQDTFAAYQALVDRLEKKLGEDEATREELYLLGLSYAALLRSYGKNEAYQTRGGNIVEQLKTRAPISPETRKVEAAFLISKDAQKAWTLLEPIAGESSQDKEALFLAGLAMSRQQKWREAEQFFGRVTSMDAGCVKAYQALGDLQSSQGDFDSALLSYQKVLEKNPRHLYSALELSRILIQHQAGLDKAEETLKQVFGTQFEKLSPAERARAYFLRAKIYLQRHENQKAVADLNTATQLAPSQVEVLTALGEIYLKTAQFSQALAVFDQALSFEPKNLDALMGKGRAMWREGNIVQANALIEKATSEVKRDPRLLHLLGQISEDLDKPDQALDRYQKALKLDPNFLLARVDTARLLLKQGRQKKAMEELTAAATANPQSAVVHLGLGEAYAGQGRLELAKKEIEEALRIDPELAPAHFNLAQVLREMKKYYQAIDEYQKVAKLSPGYPNLAYEQGHALFLQQRHPEALKLFEEAIRENPRNDRLYLRAALVAEASGDAPKAIKYFQTAIGLNQANTEAYLQLGLLFQRQEDHEKALELFRQVANLDRHHADARYRMGLSYVGMEMPTEAIDEFQEAIQRNAKHVDAMIELGRVFTNRLDFDEAIRWFNRAVQNQPKRLDVLLALGDAYSQQGLHLKALKIFQKAYASNRNFPGIAYRLGRAFDDLEKRREAIKFYLIAIKRDPQDPLPHFYLAYVHKAMGKNRKAISEFRRYLDLKPDAQDADEVRDEIEYLRNE